MYRLLILLDLVWCEDFIVPPHPHQIKCVQVYLNMAIVSWDMHRVFCGHSIFLELCGIQIMQLIQVVCSMLVCVHVCIYRHLHMCACMYIYIYMYRCIDVYVTDAYVYGHV